MNGTGQGPIRPAHAGSPLMSRQTLRRAGLGDLPTVRAPAANEGRS